MAGSKSLVGVVTFFVIFFFGISLGFGEVKTIMIDDFESGVGAWSVYFTKNVKNVDRAKYNISLSDDAKMGSKSALIKADWVEGKEYKGILLIKGIDHDKIIGENLTEAVITMWIKPLNPELNLRVRLIDTENHRAERNVQIKGKKWQKVNLPVKSFATIGSGLFNPNKLTNFKFVWRGTSWPSASFLVDQIQLELPQKELVTFELDQIFYFKGADNEAKIDISMNNNREEKKNQTFELTVTDETKKNFLVKEVPKTEKSVSFEIKDFPPGKYTVQLNVFGNGGRVKTKPQFFTILEEPKMCPIVSFRKDNVMLLDGKPFFPLGLYCVGQFGDIEQELKDTQEMGFNMAQSYLLNPYEPLEHTKSYLDFANKYGLKVMSGGLGRLDTPERKAFISRFRGHPSLLVYYLDDEPSYSGVEVGLIKQAVREIDTTRPTAITHYHIPRYEDLVARADVFIADRYPVGEPGLELTAVRDRVVAASEIAKGKIPIWFVIQALNKKAYQPDFPGGLPTYSQERFMVFSAIINGAKGLFFYSSAGGSKRTWTSQFRKDLVEIISQVKTLIPIITSQEDIRVKTELLDEKSPDFHKEIKVMGKRYENKIYLLVANESKETLRVRFILEENLKSCKVLFEKRMVKPGINNFEDEFSEYDVHIYEIE